MLVFIWIVTIALTIIDFILAFIAGVAVGNDENGVFVFLLVIWLFLMVFTIWGWFAIAL